MASDVTSSAGIAARSIGAFECEHVGPVGDVVDLKADQRRNLVIETVSSLEADAIVCAVGGPGRAAATIWLFSLTVRAEMAMWLASSDMRSVRAETVSTRPVWRALEGVGHRQKREDRRRIFLDRSRSNVRLAAKQIAVWSLRCEVPQGRRRSRFHIVHNALLA